MAQPQVSVPVLLKRIISTIVLVPPVLGAVLYGYPAFEILLIICFFIISYEWIKLCGSKLLSFDSLIFYFFGLSVITLISLFSYLWSLYSLILGFLVLNFIDFQNYRNKTFEKKLFYSLPIKVPWLSLGFLYFGISFFILIAIRAEGGSGRNIIIFLLLVVWAADIGAYIFGNLFGGPKLAPLISPKKTWSGFLGGIFCSALVGFSFSLFIIS